jgi:4-azaleucine resistance transporter AzlC
VNAETSKYYEFISGVKAEIPLLVGVFPFGLIYGVLAISSGLSDLQAQSMSFIVFAGSSQFIATQLFSTQTPGIIIIFTIMIVNLRHLLYSASISSYIQYLPEHWKWLLAYLLTDEAYAVTIMRFRQHETVLQHWFFLGAGFALWSTWQVSTAIGILLGTVIPASWSLDFTLALTFIALLVPTLVNKPDYASAIVAGGFALLLFDLPYKLGLFVAALIGIAVGVWMERRR